jgi:modulator of FtsH protease HflK
MSGNGGPWGGGGNGDDRDRGERDREPNRGGPRRPGDAPGISQIDDLVKSGQERLRVLMGGRGGGGNGRGPMGGGRGPDGPLLTKQGLALGGLLAVLAWSFMSFYTVAPEERSVELFLGERAQVGEPGLNFAPWPVITYEKVPVGVEQTTQIGLGTTNALDAGLMLTRDQNIVDIGFEVVWNISNPEDYLFNLADPEDTIRAVSESAMRDIIARSELLPILNRDRGQIVSDLRTAIQTTLDSYSAGINVLRVNLQRAAPPAPVADAFRAVQSAQQQRDTLQSQADAYANQVTAGARGQAAALLEEAEGYRARVVNNAQGEAAAFLSVYAEYIKAPEVTRRRMYLETMERVLGSMNKVILDGVGGGEAGQGVVPFLPLNELGRMAPAGAASTQTGTTTTTTGGGN